MSPELSIVIPFYNEEQNVRVVHEELTRTLQDLAREYEIIAIDDGSADATFEHLTALAASDPRLIVIRFRRNFGQTAALSAGIERARGAVIVPMDGDWQNDPADIPKLLEQLETGYDCVSGWRVRRKDHALRVLPSKLANALISMIGGVRLHDYGCTMKAYRRSVIEGVRLYGEMHRFIPIYAHWQGAKVTEMPVNHRARQHGVSKYGFNRIIKVLLDLMVVKFLFGYLTTPIYIFGGFGLMSLFFGFLAFSLAVYFKLTGQKDFVSTPLPLVTAMGGLIGCLSILLGFIAEVLVRTYYESQGTRPYIVATVLNDPAAPAKNG
ncbi:MAG: glycosyltransferase family 2 protein [Archangium sp.]|nr:glycosyltransferase family 2 protein [Archangium sp.]